MIERYRERRRGRRRNKADMHKNERESDDRKIAIDIGTKGFLHNSLLLFTKLEVGVQDIA